MKFISLRELRASTGSLRKDLAASEEFVLTANGRPVGLITSVDPDHLEEELTAVRRARARTALDRIRKAAGTRTWTMEQVDEVVKASRSARSPRTARKEK